MGDESKNMFQLTDATFPGGTILTGTCLNGFGPASAVEPHPEISAYSVGWYFVTDYRQPIIYAQLKKLPPPSQHY